MRSRLSRSLLLAVFLFPVLCKGEAPNRVTILYDAFGKSAAMTKAWDSPRWSSLAVSGYFSTPAGMLRFLSIMLKR
jgi:hypothetical protein